MNHKKVTIPWKYLLVRCVPALCILLLLLIRDPIRWWFLSNAHLRALYLLFFSCGVAYMVTPIAALMARYLGAMDHPAARKVHQVSTPYFGGLAIYVAFASTVFINNLYTVELKGVAIAGTLVFLVGLVDDVRALSAKVRLVVQFIAVGIMIEYGVRISFMPEVWWGDALEILFTFIWVIGITNAINFLDGLDGLATGSVLINAAFFSLIAFQTGQPYMRFLSVALMGSCLGFLPYNFKRRRSAEIFLGDGGSNFIGFTIAAIGILGKWGTGNSSVDLIVPILILGVPIFDTTLTTVLRIKYGLVQSFSEWIHYTGKDHFHHRLVEIGFSPKLAVLGIYTVSITLGIGASVLREAEVFDAILLLIQATIMFVMIGYFMVFVKQKYNLGSQR